MDNNHIKQNDIWMVNIGYDGIVGHEQKGTRPFYVISDTEYNTRSETPIGFFLSTSEKKRQNKYTLDIDMQGVLENVNVSQIRTISTQRFIRYMGTGTDQDLQKLISVFQQEIIKKKI